MTDPSTPVPSDEAMAAALRVAQVRRLPGNQAAVDQIVSAALTAAAPIIAAEAAAEARAERDAAILERDEMRKANIAPEDAGRPLGQSVEYWQDRALDYATAHDKARVEIAQLRRQLGVKAAEARAATLREVEAWLREAGTGWPEHELELVADDLAAHFNPEATSILLSERTEAFLHRPRETFPEADPDDT